MPRRRRFSMAIQRGLRYDPIGGLPRHRARCRVPERKRRRALRARLPARGPRPLPGVGQRARRRMERRRPLEQRRHQRPHRVERRGGDDHWPAHGARVPVPRAGAGRPPRHPLGEGPRRRVPRRRRRCRRHRLLERRPHDAPRCHAPGRRALRRAAPRGTRGHRRQAGLLHRVLARHRLPRPLRGGEGNGQRTPW